jgi:probable HAF family extracellular repeat protein
MSRRYSAFALIATAIASSIAQAQVYNLGGFGGDSNATSINDLGQVVGSSSNTAVNRTQGFLYIGPYGTGQLLNLSELSGRPFTTATGINNAGQVTGDSDFQMSNGIETHPYLYSPLVQGSTLMDLGTLGGAYGVAFGINNRGQVSGEAWTSPTFADMSFRYSGIPGQGGSMQPLGTFGGSVSLGNAINDAGTVVGVSTTANNLLGRAFYAHEGGQLTDLGALGGNQAEARAINNAGLIAGWAFTSTQQRHAFLTDLQNASAGMVDLGTLGGSTSSANGINEQGHVVGRSTLANGSEHAFLYVGTPGVDGQMIDLDAWLDLVNPVEGAYWTLETANDINNNGLVVGTGVYNDVFEMGRRAFVLDVSALIPEPASLTMLAASGGLLVVRRRK